MSDLTLWMTVILAALISLLAIYFAVLPLLQPGRATMVLDDDKLVELLGRRDSIMQAIKDLEFDYHVGKMSQEDFQRLDQRLRRQAIGLMQQIEKLAPDSASLDEQLETLIAHFRQTVVAPATAPAHAPAPAPAHAPASAIAPATGTGASTPMPVALVSKATRFCTECGKPTEPGHKFCAYCGTPVDQPNPAVEA